MHTKIVKRYGTRGKRQQSQRLASSPPQSSQRPQSQRHLLALSSEQQNDAVLVRMDFGSSKTVVAWTLDPNEDPEFLTHPSSSLNPVEIPGALTITQKDGRLDFEIGARGMHEEKSHVIQDLKVMFWIESAKKYSKVLDQRNDQLPPELKSQLSQLSPRNLLRTYLRLIREHLAKVIQRTNRDLPTSNHRYKLFAAYPGAWESTQIYAFAEQAKAAGFDECIMTITELQAQIYSPTAQKFFDKLNEKALGEHQIVFVDGGGSTTVSRFQCILRITDIYSHVRS